MKIEIQLPTKKGELDASPKLEFKQLVVVGANGAGKTRFGAKIEENNHLITHRISAQKSLTIPEIVRPKSLEIAKTEFFVGSNHPKQEVNQDLDYKKRNRWGGNFSTFLLNDFEKLLVLLHTEEYETLSESKEKKILSPRTNIDRVREIWEKVLPHRKLKIKAGVINTYPTGQETNSYNASEMSDGERVIFYLIAEVVCAPRNTILIIDEPEMHIHKSLVKNLFDLIENERTDCSFVYLTHDIDFAFSRQNATKIWAKGYENNTWDYEILDNEMPIPEQLYLEVLGSRKPIIFIEGDNSSIDYELYEQVYDDKTIKPVGSCEKVIQFTKSFRGQLDFHHIESFGIIDKDRRQEVDIVSLNRNRVWVLDVAEAENLLLLEPVVKAVANHMGKNADDVFNQVHQNIIQFFSEQIDSQILLHYKEILRREFLILSNFSSNNIADVLTEINDRFDEINKQSIFDKIDKKFRNILDDEDYIAILKVFNLKEALVPKSQVCELTGIRNKFEYRNNVITILKRKNETSQLLKTEIDNRIIKNAT